MNDSIKQRVLADLKRIEEMRSRLDPLPSGQAVLDYYEMTDARQQAILKLVVQGHQLLNRMTSAIQESPEHHFDVRDMDNFKLICGEIVTLRDVVPKADIGNRVARAHESRDDFADKQDFVNLVRQLNSTFSVPPKTLKEWTNLKELTPFKNKYKGRDTLRDWINEALPGTLKPGKPR